jgi:hypothetical protein
MSFLTLKPPKILRYCRKYNHAKNPDAGRVRKISNPIHHDEKMNSDIIRYIGRNTNASISDMPYLTDE